MQLKSYDDYIIVNNSHEDDTFEFSVLLEKCPFDSLSDSTSKYELSNVSIFRMPDRTAICAIINEIPQRDLKGPWGKGYISYVTMQPKDELHIRFETLSLRRRRDEEVFFSMYTTDGLTLEVDHSPDVDIEVASLGNFELDLVRTGETAKEWRVDGIILPYQGVIIRWQDRAPVF